MYDCVSSDSGALSETCKTAKGCLDLRQRRSFILGAKLGLDAEKESRNYDSGGRLEA